MSMMMARSVILALEFSAAIDRGEYLGIIIELDIWQITVFSLPLERMWLLCGQCKEQSHKKTNEHNQSAYVQSF